MGWLKMVLGVDKAVDIVGGVTRDGMTILDEAFDTDQEQGERKLKVFDMWLEAQRINNAQNSPTSVSRRVIAWSVMGLIWIMVAFCLTMIGMADIVEIDKTGALSMQTQVKIDAVIQIALAFKIGWAFCTVIVFYFGPHLIGKMTGRSQSGGS